jgi:hypothetical protein
MPLRTTAIEAAAARGWNKAQLADMTGLSLRTIYSLSHGSSPSAKAITAIMRVFPDLPYERLFVPLDSTKLNDQHSPLQTEAVAA